ncbi:hypothetical protein QR680_010906 [Steinernema hermaphroditum]|uniref:RBR-type E3 ubiquitin transferase n=1 Tax=Steinernema hermaphroditum TaxID=289476 RepID=A0AA39IQH0_9BILA|nr:hypothetical protein QR680_010906 [Steinernema hermaphroditum]
MSFDRDETLSDMNDFCDDVEADSSDHRVFEGATLMPRIEALVQKTNNFLDTTPINCRMLLYQFRWKDDVLIERFYDGNDVAKLLKASKVSPSEGKPLPLVSGECELCCDDSSDVIHFSCGTLVCKACFGCYLSGKIRENGAAFISCPGHKCSQLIDDDVIMKYCSDTEGYQKVVINSYVLANNQMKWCPGTDCTRVIEVNWSPNERFTKTVQCDCGKTFCFNCYGEQHEPVSCEILRKWEKKSADDSGTMNWIKENTRTCPKCRNVIEKNGGCNHMTCKQPGCGHEFCWICYADWKDHNYQCRKYVSDAGGQQTKAEAEDNQIDLEKAVEELNGYLEKDDLEDDDLELLKQNIINKSAYLEKRRTALLEHVRQGEEHDFWAFEK